MGVRTNKPESENSPEEEKPLKAKEETPKAKTFRVVNTSAQTLYLTLPGRTLVLPPATSQDVPERDIAGNYHLKVMVRRGHVSLFEY